MNPDGVSVGRGDDTGRIETFSDGVFAIAITLLILEIRVPEVEGGHTLAEALLALWPSYLAYALSFLVIGTMWANHHNRFRYIARSDHVLLFINRRVLMFTAFIPFPTALLAEYVVGSDEGRTTATVLYAGALAVTAVFFTLLWLYAASGHRLVERDVDPRLLRAMTRRYVIGVLLYTIAFALAFVSVIASLALILALALLFVLPEPNDRQRSGIESSSASPEEQPAGRPGEN